LAALGRLGSEQDVGFAVEALLRQTNAALRASTAQALCALCAGARERRECLEPVLAGYRVADAETRQALVGVLPSIGGSNALSAAVAAANDPSAAVAESAVRSLVAWPGNEPLRVLLSLSASAKEPRHRVLALRGAVAMVGREAAPADAKARLYGQALAAAERADEKRLVCAGLGGLGTAAALPHLESLLSDPSVAAESALAIAAIAEKSDAVDWPAARRAVDKALGVAGTERVRREVERVGGQLAQYEDLVPAWRVCGPYSVVNLSGDRILDEVFPPERAPESVAWRDVCATGGVLTLAFGASNDHRAAYMETFCYSPTQQLARLDIGSDDGVKVWLNGKPVHSKNALRALKPGEDKVVTTLSQGWNRLVLKVTNNYLKWEACARVRTLDGRPIPGLKYSVRPDPNPPTP
jgi:hypothetical protein